MTRLRWIYPLIAWWLSIAMLIYQRVIEYAVHIIYVLVELVNHQLWSRQKDRCALPGKWHQYHQVFGAPKACQIDFNGLMIFRVFAWINDLCWKFLVFMDKKWMKTTWEIKTLNESDMWHNVDWRNLDKSSFNPQKLNLKSSQHGFIWFQHLHEDCLPNCPTWLSSQASFVSKGSLLGGQRPTPKKMPTRSKSENAPDFGTNLK